jgi:predicted kinase
MSSTNPKSIILLSAPVGAGKTTVAKELIATSPGPTAHIEGDKFWAFTAKEGPGHNRHKNFRLIMTAMTAAAVPYAVAGYEVILDFSVPPWFLDKIRKVVKVRDVPVDYVVLRPSETVCSVRAAARPEGKIADYSEYRDFYATFDGAEEHTIRDDHSDAETVARLIRDGLKKGSFRLQEQE